MAGTRNPRLAICRHIRYTACVRLALYLLRRFFATFAGALIMFSFAMLLLDLTTNLWKYNVNHAPMLQILRVSCLYVPKTFSLFAPVAVLFSTAYVLSGMHSSNELIAVFAGGISLFRCTLPLLVSGLVLSAACFLFEDKVVVPTYKAKNELQARLMADSRSGPPDNVGVVLMSEGGAVVYHADSYIAEQRRLNGVTVVLRGAGRELECVIRADAAVWEEGTMRWDLHGAVQYVPDGDGLAAGAQLDERMLARLTEIPDSFKSNTASVEEEDVATAREYIAYLRRAGLPFAKELTDYYRKFSWPFVIFITVFLAIGLSGRTRQNVLIVTLACCIAATAVYYVFQMITGLMSQFGYIPPAAGAWAPAVLFTAASAVLLRRART